MKRYYLAGVAALALASAANAADLSRPMLTKAPMYAPFYNWTGLYAGINGGGAFGSSKWGNPSTGSFDVSGGLVGGTLGYNWQYNQFVFGLEGDMDWADIDGNTNRVAGAQAKADWLATVRGRVGYAFDRWMPYFTGGLAIGDVKANVPGFAGATSTQTGFAVGAGLEFALAPNWTAKVEYLYVDLGNFNCGANCGGFNPDKVDFTANIVRGGVNYRF